MAKTKRVQVLMEPSEFEAVERAARARQVSVADLFRAAVREQFLDLAARQRRLEAAKSFLAQPTMELPPWPEVKRIIGERYESTLLP
jgi:hypothetical protein